MGEFPHPRQEAADESVEGRSYLELMRELEDEINLRAIYMSRIELYEFCAAVTDRLHAESPYMNEPVYIRGRARLPNPSSVDEDYDLDEPGDVLMLPQDSLEKRLGVKLDNITYDETAETFSAVVDGVFGMYRGVQIGPEYDREGNRRYEIRHAINIGTDSVTSHRNTVINHMEFMGFFDSRSQLVTSEELEEAVHGGELRNEFSEATQQELVNLSGTLIDLLSSTGFRRLNRRKQVHLYESIIEETKELSGIVEDYVEIIFREGMTRGKFTPCIYIPTYDGNGNLVYARETLEDANIFEVNGLCLGIASVDEINISSGSIRSDNDLIDKHAGLCLVIDPGIYDDEEDDERGQRLLYIPLGKGEHIRSIRKYSGEDPLD